MVLLSLRFLLGGGREGEIAPPAAPSFAVALLVVVIDSEYAEGPSRPGIPLPAGNIEEDEEMSKQTEKKRQRRTKTWLREAGCIEKERERIGKEERMRMREKEEQQEPNAMKENNTEKQEPLLMYVEHPSNLREKKNKREIGKEQEESTKKRTQSWSEEEEDNLKEERRRKKRREQDRVPRAASGPIGGDSVTGAVKKTEMGGRRR